MMVQRREEEDEYIPRRKVIMTISSESDEDYAPKRPSGNDKHEERNKDTKKSESPIKNGETKKIVFPEVTVHLPRSLNNGTRERISQRGYLLVYDAFF